MTTEKNWINGPKLLIILGLALWSLPVFSQLQTKLRPYDCMYKSNTICQKLVKLNPKIDHKLAYKYSNYFHKMAKKYHLDPNLLISIAFQESSFKADAIRKIKGLVFDEDGETFKEVKIGADFCMMQIHASNIKKLELDPNKLLKSPKYCIEAGARILSQYKKKFAKKDPKWWTYYNAIQSDKRDIYHRMVSRHLTKLKTSIKMKKEKVDRKLASNN